MRMATTLPTTELVLCNVMVMIERKEFSSPIVVYWYMMKSEATLSLEPSGYQWPKLAPVTQFEKSPVGFKVVNSRPQILAGD